MAAISLALTPHNPLKSKMDAIAEHVDTAFEIIGRAQTIQEKQ